MNLGLKAKDYTSLYIQLGRLLENAPSTTDAGAFRTQEALHWLGRADALVSEVGVGAGMDAIEFRSAMKSLKDGVYGNGLIEIFQILYRALAHSELKSPGAANGSFIPVGNSFDAFAALAKIFKTATTDVLIVDPYMDETALTEFGSAVNDGIVLRLLADESAYKATLGPAVKKWMIQYGTARPLDVRLSPAKTLHDRAIFVDSAKAWILTQSLKDFAKRSPAEIVRADDTAALKIAAYEQLWSTANRIG
jgi:hypothetical protein